MQSFHFDLMAVCAMNKGHTRHAITFEVRPMYKMMRCSALENGDIPMRFETMIANAKALNIDGSHSLFHFIFMPI